MMYTLKRPPQRNLPSNLCSQCRHAHITKTKPKTRQRKDIVALKATAQELEERASILRNRVHAARKARREDWFLGPLAPNRFALNEVEGHGCVDLRELNGVKGLEATRQGRSPYMPREMSWKESMIKVGDRVVVVGGEGKGEGMVSRDRGKVGKVVELRKSTGDCVVEDLNMVDIKTPGYIQEMEPGSPSIRAVPMPIPLSAVRLIYPLKVPEERDASGNITRESYYQDAIISKLVRRPGHKGRFIANSDRAMGQWVEIPKHPDASVQAAPPKDHDIDTLRIEVEEETWNPTLLRAPMPATVIDELRNKYSRHRTRHEPAYQAALDNRIKRREMYKAWAKQGGGMLSSPAKEARAKQVWEMKHGAEGGGGKPGLKREILERIGEVMARKGVEMTEGRRREMERNLEREGVLRGIRGEVGEGENRGSGNEYEVVEGGDEEVRDAVEAKSEQKVEEWVDIEELVKRQKDGGEDARRKE